MAEAALVVRFSVAALFLTAGAVKFSSRDTMSLAVEQYGLLPARLAATFGRLLIPAELLLGGLLLLGVLPGLMLRLLGTLLLVFAAAVATNLVRGREIDCGCWGNNATPITWGLCLRNAVLALLAWIASFAQPPGVSLFDPSARGGSVGLMSLLACVLLPALALVGFRLAIIAAPNALLLTRSRP